MRLAPVFLFLTIILLAAIAAPAGSLFGPTTKPAAVPPPKPIAPQTKLAPALLTRVQAAIFEVRSKTGSAPAILINKDGLAITSFHAFRGAHSAVGIFAAEPKREVPLQLWAVEPKLDLAIVQITPGHTEDMPLLYGHIDIEDSPPARNDPVWSPELTGPDFSVVSGTILALQENRALPRDLQRQFFQHTSWIQTDCPVNTANGGGPLINAKGKLVGINVWRWDRSDVNNYYAMTIAPVKELLAALPKDPLTFPAAALRFGKVAGPRLTFPDLPFLRDRSAEPIASQAAVMANSGICDTCHGKGVVLRKVVVGERGNYIKSPIYKDVEEQCPACKGSKYNTVALRNVSPRLVEAFARAKPDDPEIHRATAQAVMSLRKLLEVDPVRLDRVLAGDSESEVAHGGSPLGEPIIAVSTSLEEVHLPGEAARYPMVKSGTAYFIMRDPVVIQAGPKSHAIFGGIMAGDVERYDGVAVHVLQDGFVVGTP